VIPGLPASAILRGPSASCAISSGMNFPHEWLHVLEILKEVYTNDAMLIFPRWRGEKDFPYRPQFG